MTNSTGSTTIEGGKKHAELLPSINSNTEMILTILHDHNFTAQTLYPGPQTRASKLDPATTGVSVLQEDPVHKRSSLFTLGSNRDRN